jgi:hypothetical protein
MTSQQFTSNLSLGRKADRTIRDGWALDAYTGCVALKGAMVAIDPASTLDAAIPSM